MFSDEVIEVVQKEYLDDWVEMMREFEKLKRKISLNKKEDFVQIALRHCFHEVYHDLMDVNLNNAFKNNLAGTRGAILNRNKLQIPKGVISQMIKQVSTSISSHTTFLLQLEEIEHLDFIVMVGGFSNSPIVVQEVKDHVPSSLPVIVPENPELSVVQGAVMFGWKPEMFKSRKSRRSYGVGTHKTFRENIDPERLMFYDENNVKKCKKRFSKLVNVGEEIEIGKSVKKKYRSYKLHGLSHSKFSIYESENNDVTYYDEPGVRKLGSIGFYFDAGDVKREVEVTLLFGGTEIFVTCKDLENGLEYKAVYDFL